MIHSHLSSDYGIVFQAICSPDAPLICRRFTTATLYALACFLLIAPGTALAGGFEVYGGKYTERDKQSLPPVCRLILFEKGSAHQPEGQRIYSDLLSLPQYRMAKNNIHLHHYCYGLLSRFRYFSSTSPIDRKLFAMKFQDELDYVIVNQGLDDKNWPYFDQLYYEQAEMLFTTSKYAEATAKALKALSITPSYAKARALLSDTYMKTGKRDLALKQLHEGLAENPASKPLRRRLREIDPNDPFLAQPIPEAPRPTDTAANKEPPATSAEEVEPSPTVGASGSEGQDKPISKPTVAPNPDNPYCRFCP